MPSTCRLCLCKSQICVSLLENNGNEIVESLTSIKIRKDDNLPLGACVKCWLNIKLAYRIRQDILECDKRIRSISLADDTSTSDPLLLSLKMENTLNDSPDLLSESEDVEIEKILIKKEDHFSEDGLEEETDSLDKVCFVPFAAKCSICGDAVDEGEMGEHVKEHFTQRQECEDCDLQLDNIKSFQEHIANEHPLDALQTFKCDKCSARFKYKSLYRIHAEKAHVSRQKLEEGKKPPVKKTPVQCSECKKMCSNEDTLVTHMKRHIKKTCPICQAECLPDNFKKHVENHSAAKVVCHLCGIVAKNYGSLRGHLYYTHSTNQFPCPHCDKSFRKSYTRILHIKKEHTGEKNHVCDVCGKGFYTKYCLNKHIKMTHLKLRPYVCEYCQKAFSSRFALRTHVRQHTNDAPYKCDVCGEGFRQNVSMRAHKKTKHNIVEEKTVPCKVCGKVFATDWAVQCHMRLH